MLLLAAHHRRGWSSFSRLQRQRFLLMRQADDDYSADQYSQQHQRNRDLKVPRNH